MAVFPTFKNGVVLQYPYSEGQHYLTQVSIMADGHQLARYIRPDGRAAWSVQYKLNDAEILDLIAFVESIPGRCGYFDFAPPPPDPSDPVTTYHNCRLSSDDLTVTHVGKNQHSVTLQIEQVMAIQ